MFTGIIEEAGELVAQTQAGDVLVLTVHGPRVSKGARQGDSIAVNGCCLTVIDDHDSAAGILRFELVPQSQRLTSLGTLPVGARVNLERALPVNGRFGGHIVQGHVDGVAVLVSRERLGHSEVFTFGTPCDLAAYIMRKGSIALDGVSLTVSGATSSTFTTAIIPTTIASTNLTDRKIGELLNVEVDAIVKCVERFTAKTFGAN